MNHRELERAGWPIPEWETPENYCADLNGTDIAWLAWSRTAPQALIDAAWEEISLRVEAFDESPTRTIRARAPAEEKPEEDRPRRPAPKKPDFDARCARCDKEIETQRDAHSRRIGVLVGGMFVGLDAVCVGCLMREEEERDAARWPADRSVATAAPSEKLEAGAYAGFRIGSDPRRDPARAAIYAVPAREKAVDS